MDKENKKIKERRKKLNLFSPSLNLIKKFVVKNKNVDYSIVLYRNLIDSRNYKFEKFKYIYFYFISALIVLIIVVFVVLAFGFNVFSNKNTKLIPIQPSTKVTNSNPTSFVPANTIWCYVPIIFDFKTTRTKDPGFRFRVNYSYGFLNYLNQNLNFYEIDKTIYIDEVISYHFVFDIGCWVSNNKNLNFVNKNTSYYGISIRMGQISGTSCFVLENEILKNHITKITFSDTEAKIFSYDNVYKTIKFSH